MVPDESLQHDVFARIEFEPRVNLAQGDWL
jgi:hypothetical protein